MEFKEYKRQLSYVNLGKKLPDAVYLHKTLIKKIACSIQELIHKCIESHQLQNERWNIIKLFRKDFKISLLYYPYFEYINVPNPELHHSISIDINLAKIRKTDYTKSSNKPILHRKETFISPDHHLYKNFSEQTKQAEALGLFKKKTHIGFKNSWHALLKKENIIITDQGFFEKKQIEVNKCQDDRTEIIERHSTAIKRGKLSLPMNLLAKHRYLSGEYSILDYGCGLDQDCIELRAHGIIAHSWDPYYKNEGKKVKCDIVNLGYVINVIENITERAEALKSAYKYATKLLVVSALTGSESCYDKYTLFNDGIVTSRNTFQKYYSQNELKKYIENILDNNAIALTQGVFFVFKDKIHEQEFLLKRQFSKSTWTYKSDIQLSVNKLKSSKTSIKQRRFDQYKHLLDAYWDICMQLGRHPKKEEYDHYEEAKVAFGSYVALKNYFSDEQSQGELKKACEQRYNDLTVFLALSLFSKRPIYSEMPIRLKNDIKHFFCSISEGMNKAQSLLFSLGDPQTIYHASIISYNRLGSGELQDEHSYIFHKSLLQKTSPVIRVFVGCAGQLYGDIDEFDLIKVHIQSGKLSLMKYDDFDQAEYPRLLLRVKIKLRELDFDVFDYNKISENYCLENKQVYLKTLL